MQTVKITSRCTLDAGSLGRLPIKEGAEIYYGSLKREPVMGDAGALGFSESYEEAPGFKCTIIHAQSTDEDAIGNFVNENLVLVTNTGKVYSLLGGYVSNSQTLNVKDGQLEVEFRGAKMIVS